MKKNRTKPTQKNLKDIKVWYRDDYVKSDGTCAISLMVYIKNKRVVFNTGVSVSSTYWDENENTILPKHEKAKDYNLIIDNCKTRINDIFVRYRLQHKELTPELLKREYQIFSTYIEFYPWLKKTIESRRGIIKESTYRQHMVLLSKLELYKKDLMFSEIDDKFINAFTIWLKKQQKNDIGTVYNTLKKFRTYINIALHNRIITADPFERVKLIRNKPDRDFLTEQELNKFIILYRKKVLPLAQQIAIRHFLFQCFTGLRVSDLRQVKFENIVNNMLLFIPQKTNTTKPATIKVPLTKPALKLIKDESGRIRGPLFKMTSEQNMNRLLKEIIKHDEIKLNKRISTHCGRHTFATLFLKKTKNIVALKEILGHSNIQTTMVYAHLLTDDLVTEMKVFNDFKL